MDWSKANDLSPSAPKAILMEPKKPTEQTPFKILKGEEVCRGPAEALHPKGVVVQVSVF